MPLKNCTVLIVNDSSMDRTIYRSYLQQETSFAYTVWEAESTEAALRLCRSQPPDSIVLDYLLPDRNGLEFLSSLKSSIGENCPPVIMLNEQGNEAIAIQAFKAGVEDYLIKEEITSESLRYVTRTAIKNFQLRQELRQREEHDQAMTEQSLRQSEDFNRQILETLPDCVTVLDLEGNIQYINAAGKCLLGLDDESCCNANLLNLWQVSSDQQRLQQAIDEAIAGTTSTFQGYCPTSNGTPKWWEVIITPIFDVNRQVASLLSILRDLTERRQLEASSQQQLAQLEAIYATAPIGLCFLDPQRRHVQINEKLAEINGLSISEHIGRTVEEIVPELAATLEPIFEQVLRTGIPVLDLEIRGTTPAQPKVERYWLANYYPLKTADGESLGINITVQEITERKQAEALVQQQLAQIEAIYATAPIGLCFLDRELRFVQMNERLAEINGLSVAEQLGRTIWEVLPKLAETQQPIFEQVFQTGLPILDVEVQGITPAQPEVERHWLVSYYPLTDKDEEVIGINITVLEITDRKLADQRLQESEERLQLGIQVADIALARFDYASNTVKLSPEAAVLYGLPIDELTVTRDRLHATFHPEEREIMEQMIQQALDPTGDGWFAREHRVVWLNGEVRWLYVRKQIFFERSRNSPRPNYAILVAIDITDRKQAEKEREQLLVEAQASREAAEEANRSKDELVAVIAHELRSPINSVAGWAQLLRMRKFDQATVDRALEAIERGTQTQVQLIEDLLDISRIACGTLRLTFAPLNLTTVIQAAISLVRPMADAKQIALETQLTTIAQIYGDLNRLQQIAVNLLTNAIKFTPEQGRVTIIIELVAQQVRIQVKDSGKGINPEFLPQIFDQFRQGQKNSGSKDGLGLGLAIAKNLVELHHGTITAESPGLGQGATFTVWLPLHESQPVVIPAEIPTVTDENPLAGIRILAIDDEPDSLELLRFILDNAGAEVQTASNGAIALDLISQFDFELLVSDIAMPDINGHELIQQIQTLYPERRIRAIALTAYASSSDRDYSLRLGFEKYFSKPIDPEVLITAIVNLIHHP